MTEEERVRRVSKHIWKENPVPFPIRNLMGVVAFTIKITSNYHKKKFDEENALSFESEAPVFKDKISALGVSGVGLAGSDLDGTEWNGIEWDGMA